jgi:hypothetical protein
MAKGCAFVIAIVSGCLWAGMARAEPTPDNVARAREFVLKAKELESAGQYHEACPLFALSYALDPHPGELFNLAYCYEKDDRIASAWLTWIKGAEMAEASGDGSRAAAAREHARDIESKVPRVTVTVAPQAKGMPVEVTLDGSPVASDEWGKAIPVDPGRHEILAAGRVLQTWSKDFVASSEQAPTVEVPELGPAPSSISPTPAPERKGSALRSVAWSLGGVGLAALGVGAAFGIAGLVNKNASTEDRHCVPFAGLNRCDVVGSDDVTRARFDFQAADVSYVVGGGLLVTAAALWFVSRQGTPRMQPARLMLRPEIARQAWSATLEATW